MRTVYLGTTEFAAAVLRILGGSAHRPSLVVTRPDRPRGRGRRLTPPPVALEARELGIELHQPEAVNDDAARARISAAGPEVVCVCAFGALIKEPLLSEHPMLNVHPSLLPRWRGAAPIERAIIAGDERTGVSIMRLTAGLDSGPVCAQRDEPIEPGDTYGTLVARLQAIGGELLVTTLEQQPPCAEQDEAGVTYAEKLGPADRELDPGRPALELERVVRALTPHIGAHVTLPDGTSLGVREARPVPGDTTSHGTSPGEATPHGTSPGEATRHGTSPGESTPHGTSPGEATPHGTSPGAVSLDGPRPVLRCADGALELVVVQPPGRRPMSGEEFLRGYRR